MRSSNAALAGYKVSLFASLVDHAGGWQLLGSDLSDASGDFQIFYDLPPGRSVLIVQAQRGRATLASAIGDDADPPARVVINERTTVATGNAFAQFVDGARVLGNPVGMINAVRMAGNLAHPGTGDAAAVISLTPNGAETSTFATFNSLANAVAACVASERACLDLFEAAKPPGGAAPGNVPPSGALLETLPGTYQGTTVITKPIGNAVDSRGNVWVANSDWLDSPCPTRHALGKAENPSVTMYRASDRRPQPGSPFKRGGISLPWGVTIDGDDTVWVLNFGALPPGPGNSTQIPNRVSRLCGADTARCPPGLATGDPISPATGYQSDALQRMTAGAIDPSGNLWVTNNWKIDVDPFQNPGGNAVVILIGAAAPIRTPVIGPPVAFR